MSTATQSRAAATPKAPQPRIKSEKRRRREAIRAIRRETRCTVAEAQDFIGFLTEAVQHGHGTYHLTGTEFECHHEVYAIVMPANTPAKPGSAHAAVEALFSTENTIVALMHTGTTNEGVQDCTTTVTITTVKA